MGSRLINKVIQLSGLPKELIEKEVFDILKKEGIKPDHVTEDILRQVLANYLRDILNRYST